MSTNTAAPEVWYAPDIQPRHDWMSVGAKVHAPDEKAQARILRAIADIINSGTTRNLRLTRKP